MLSQGGSRQGVEVAERYLTGTASLDELKAVGWYVEGDAFNLDYNSDPEAIQRMVDEVRAIPPSDMAAMLHPPGVPLDVDTQKLLMRAAYFAHFATMYPLRRPTPNIPKSYVMFLSADLLREQFAQPFP